jgi:prepilin-type N-terminal cleavage/methylation domain-containing protein
MKKGFTLIELLIVIGILAVLSSAVVVVLNPAQLLAQARDTQRLNDLSSLSSAISYFLSTTNLTSSLMAPGSAGNACATNWWGSYASIGVSPFTVPAATILPGNQSAQVSRAVTGTGWVPVKLDKSNDGNGPSPLGTLPVDPTNASGKFYAYSCNENNNDNEKINENNINENNNENINEDEKINKNNREEEIYFKIIKTILNSKFEENIINEILKITYNAIKITKDNNKIQLILQKSGNLSDIQLIKNFFIEIKDEYNFNFEKGINLLIFVNANLIKYV